MSNVHVYIGIENLALTVTQRNTLVARLQSLGALNTSAQPAERNHWRIRTDNQAAIFEAAFDENTITIAAVKQYLATIFNVDVSTITHSSQMVSYGLLITLIRSATNQIRLVLFGYDGGIPTWQQSGAAVRAYLAANAAAWGDV